MLKDQKLLDRLASIEENLQSSSLDKSQVFASLQEMLDNITDTMSAFNQLNELAQRIRIAQNNQAEVLGLLRYTISKYLPQQHLDEAAAEYRALREQQIATEPKAPEGKNFVN